MADPPCCLQNSAFLFPASLPQTSNTLTFDREKNTSFDSILQRLYLQKKSEKKKKKSHFLADGSVWNRSQESCFWFMLNCTLNTEQYSCPFFILFTLYLLHIHTCRKYTHPPTPVSKNLYPPVPNIQLMRTLHPEKYPHFMYKFRVQHVFFFLDVLYPFPTIGPPINLGFSCCFCCIQNHYVLGMYITILSVAMSHC